MIDSKLEILLVEDNVEDVDLLETAFKECGLTYELNVCDDGEKGLQYLNRENPYEKARLPDIVVLDLNLPKKDGREVLRDMRKTLPTLPVLVMTTAVNEQEVKEILSYPHTEFYAKPRHFKGYKKVVERIRKLGSNPKI